jgi:hypothetical protein
MLAALWRSKTSFDLKAAALAVGTVMVVAFFVLYDLVILAVAILLRGCGETGPTSGEMRALALAGFLILIFPLLKAPVGFAAALLVALLIMRRAGSMLAWIGPSPSGQKTSRLSSHAFAATHPCGNS